MPDENPNVSSDPRYPPSAPMNADGLVQRALGPDPRVSADPRTVGGPMTFGVNVQPTYPTEMGIALAGMPATMHGWDADSYIVETAAGIGFARAVSQSAVVGNERCVILGGTQVAFLGITYRDITLLPRIPEFNAYGRYDTCGVMISGDIWVDTKEAVLVTDAVAFDTATGQFGKTGILVPNAKWMRSAALGGVAIVRVSGPYRAAA